MFPCCEELDDANRWRAYVKSVLHQNFGLVQQHACLRALSVGARRRGCVSRQADMLPQSVDVESVCVAQGTSITYVPPVLGWPGPSVAPRPWPTASSRQARRVNPETLELRYIAFHVAEFDVLIAPDHLGSLRSSYRVAMGAGIEIVGQVGHHRLVVSE